MDPRSTVARLTGGTLLSAGGLVVLVAALAGIDWYGAAPAGPRGASRPPPLETAVRLGAFVLLASPLVAAGTAVMADRRGAPTAVAGMFCGVFGAVLGVGLGGRYPILGPLYPDEPVFESIAVSSVIVGGVVLLLGFPLAVVHGWNRYDDRVGTDERGLPRVARLLSGPLFPFAAVLFPMAIVFLGTEHSVEWTLPKFVVVAASPFVVPVAVWLRNLARTERFGDLSVAERALWALGTRPLITVAVGVVGVVAATAVTNIVVGSISLTAGLTARRVLVAGVFPAGLGMAYVWTGVPDHLEAWRDELAATAGDGDEDGSVPTLTVLDCEGRIARVGPPRTVRVVHLRLEESAVQAVTTREVDVPSRAVVAVDGREAIGTTDLVGVSDGRRVHLRSADGDMTLRPVGDPERLVAALDRRYPAEARIGGNRASPADHRTGTGAGG